MKKVKINDFLSKRKNRLHLDRQKAYDLDPAKIRVKSEGLLPMVGEKVKK